MDRCSSPSQTTASGSSNNNGDVEKMQVDCPLNNKESSSETGSTGGPSASSGCGLNHSTAMPTTEELEGFRSMIQKFTSVMKDQMVDCGSNPVTTLQDINDCNDVEGLREKCRVLFHKQDFLQFQLEISELKNKLDHHKCVKEQDEKHAQAFILQKEEIFQQIHKILEEEFQCYVCSEIFIEPCVIKCGHTFCKFCITECKREKRECPACRQYIEIAGGVKHVQIANLIEKLHSVLPQDIQEKREKAIREREEQTVAAGTQLRPGTVMGDVVSFTAELQAMQNRHRTQLLDRHDAHRGATRNSDTSAIDLPPQPSSIHHQVTLRSPLGLFSVRSSMEERSSESQAHRRVGNSSEASAYSRPGTSALVTASLRNEINNNNPLRLPNSEDNSSVESVPAERYSELYASGEQRTRFTRPMTISHRTSVHRDIDDSLNLFGSIAADRTTSNRGEPPGDSTASYVAGRNAMANQRSILHRMSDRNRRVLEEENSDEDSAGDSDVEEIPSPIRNAESQARASSLRHRVRPPIRRIRRTLSVMRRFGDTTRRNLNNSNSDTTAGNIDADGNPHNPSLSAEATTGQPDSDQNSQTREVFDGVDMYGRRFRCVGPRCRRHGVNSSRSRSANNSHHHGPHDTTVQQSAIRSRSGSRSRSVNINPATTALQTTEPGSPTIVDMASFSFL